MQNISIGIYTVRLYDSKENADIDVEDNEYSISLSSIIKEYLKVMTKKGKIYKKEKSVIIIDDFLENTEQNIAGVIKTGEYGYESELYDIKENIKKLERENFFEAEIDEKTFKNKNIKPKTTAEIMPFVYNFYLKNNQNKKLYLALERIGQYGIKTKIEIELNNFLRQRYPEYKNLKIKVHDLISEKMIKAYYKKEGLNNLTLTKYKVPIDIANKLKNNGADPEDFMIDITLKPKKKGLKIRNWISLDNFFSSRNKNINDIIEIKENKELEYDKVSAEVSIEGRRRKIDFSNLFKFKVYEIVDIKRKENGHPEEKELLSKMKEKLKEIIEEIDVV